MNPIITKNGKNALMVRPNNTVAPKPAYTATPTTRNGDGFHRGDGKPTDGHGQWVLQPSGKLPPRAFVVHEKERQLAEIFWHSVPLDANALGEIQRIGGEIFDATYGAEGKKFEREISAGQLEIERLSAERSRLNADLENIPATVEKEQAEPRFPKWFSAKWWGFAICLLLLCVSSGAALLQISNLYLPTMQSWLFSCVAASPWILAAVAAEIFVLVTVRSESPKFTWAMRGAALVLIVGIVMWLAGLFPLAAPLNVGDLTSNNFLLPDRRLALAGQLLCELAVSFMLLTAMLKLLNFQRVTVPNENRLRIAACIAELDSELGGVLRELAKPEGNFVEWENSRAAFIQEGISIYHLRMEGAALMAEIQRKLGENQHLLGYFRPDKNKPK